MMVDIHEYPLAEFSDRAGGFRHLCLRDTIVIPLTKGRFTIVSELRYPLVSDYRWCAQKARTTSRELYYAITNIPHPDGGFILDSRGYYTPRRATLRMHNLIMGVKDIDHWNGDGLDNRDSNLVPATKPQNAAKAKRYSSNTSGHVGVRKDKRYGKWTVEIGSSPKQYQGTYDEFLDAVAVYHSAARELYGEFAPVCCDRMDLIDE